MVAKHEGRVEEYREEKQRRLGGLDSLSKIDANPGRGGKMTREEQMKMDEIRQKEKQQDSILDAINDNLDFLNMRAQDINDEIEDSTVLVKKVTRGARKVDGKVGALREDVQDATAR